MKLLFTNRGIITEQQYNELREDDSSCVESYGVAGGIGEDMSEGGPSTRRAERDQAIDSSISDAEDDVVMISGTAVPRDVWDSASREERSHMFGWNDAQEQDPSFLGDEDGYLGDDSWTEEDEARWQETEDRIAAQGGEGFVDEAQDLDHPDFFGDEPSEPGFVGSTRELPPEISFDIGRKPDATAASPEELADEEEEFQGHTFSDEEWFVENVLGESKKPAAKKMSISQLKETIRSIIRESKQEMLKKKDLSEELAASQTGFADMQPTVVSEEEGSSGMQEKAPPGMEDVVLALKKKFGKDSPRPYQIAWSQYNDKRKSSDTTKKEVVSEEEEEPAVEGWILLLRKVKAGSSKLNKEWPELYDQLEASGVMFAMPKIRAMENVLGNIAQGLQFSKDMGKAKKHAAQAMSKNSIIKKYIPVELGGEFA